MRQETKNKFICLGIILLLTFLFLSPALKNGLISNDDNLHVYDNPSIRGLEAENIKQIFTKLFNPTYVPLTQLTFALEYHFVKYDPFLYHLDNLLLHLAVTGLIFYFALLIGLPLRAAFFAGLLFGIHPMHVESVAWVTERKDVLYSFFYMLALIFYWKYLSGGSKKFYAATILCGLLSVLAKSMALSLPLVMLICDWYKGRKLSKWMILDKIPHFLYIIPISLVTYLANIRNPIQNAEDALLTWVWCLVFYFQKFLFPFNLIIFYKFPQPIAITTPEFFLSLLVFLLFLFAVWNFRTNRLFIFAVLFYFFSIFFLFRFDDIKYLPPVSDRFMYLPSLGFCFLFGAWIDLLYKKSADPRRMVSFVLTILFLCLGIASYSQTHVWRSSLSFWSRELQYDPNNAMALVNRGEALKDIKKYNEAFADFDHAVNVDPDYAEGYNSRGQMYGMGGHLDLAEKDFLKGISLKPNYDEIYNNLGIVYAMKNEPNKAVLNFKKAIAIDPANAEARFNLQLILKQQKKQK